MKKISSTLLFVILVTSALAQFPNPYCGPLTFSVNVEPITLVNFAGINNSSSATVSGTAHENFTAISGNITAGQTYPITLKGNTDGDYRTVLSVFIDINRDNDFLDPNERVFTGEIVNSTGTDTTKLAGNISIPNYAKGGATRMRVVKVFDQQDPNYLPDPCNANAPQFGQAEDYTLQVTAIAQCLTGTKFPANTLTIPNCNGAPLLVSNVSETGHYFEFNATQGILYTIRSNNFSDTADYFTISTDGGATADFAARGPIRYRSSTTGLIRVYIHKNMYCGLDTLKRSTYISCGDACLDGILFPAQTFTPSVCDGSTMNLITNASTTGQYSNVQVSKGSTYRFSTSNPNDYISLSYDGITAFAKGKTPLDIISDTTFTIRFYVHSDQYCGTDTSIQSKFVICSLLEPPGCVTNLFPEDGDTVYVSVGTYEFTWDEPTTGGPADWHAINFGLNPNTSIYTFEFIPFSQLQITFEASDVGNLYYWWITSRNAAGSNTCTPIKNTFKVLASPNTVGVNSNLFSKVSAYPNPMKDKLFLKNAEDVYSYKVLNSIGQLVLQSKFNNKQTAIDLNKLEPGIYLLVLSIADGSEQNIRIIKE